MARERVSTPGSYGAVDGGNSLVRPSFAGPGGAKVARSSWGGVWVVWGAVGLGGSELDGAPPARGSEMTDPVAPVQSSPQTPRGPSARKAAPRECGPRGACELDCTGNQVVSPARGNPSELAGTIVQAARPPERSASCWRKGAGPRSSERVRRSSSESRGRCSLLYMKRRARQQELSGRPRWLPTSAPHGSGRAGLLHPALLLTGSLRTRASCGLLGPVAGDSGRGWLGSETS